MQPSKKYVSSGQATTATASGSAVTRVPSLTHNSHDAHVNERDLLLEVLNSANKIVNQLTQSVLSADSAGLFHVNSSAISHTQRRNISLLPFFLEVAEELLRQVTLCLDMHNRDDFIWDETVYIAALVLNGLIDKESYDVEYNMRAPSISVDGTRVFQAPGQLAIHATTPNGSSSHIFYGAVFDQYGECATSEAACWYYIASNFMSVLSSKEKSAIGANPLTIPLWMLERQDPVIARIKHIPTFSEPHGNSPTPVHEDDLVPGLAVGEPPALEQKEDGTPTSTSKSGDADDESQPALAPIRLTFDDEVDYDQLPVIRVPGLKHPSFHFLGCTWSDAHTVVTRSTGGVNPHLVSSPDGGKIDHPFLSLSVVEAASVVSNAIGISAALDIAAGACFSPEGSVIGRCLVSNLIATECISADGDLLGSLIDLATDVIARGKSFEHCNPCQLNVLACYAEVLAVSMVMVGPNNTPQYKCHIDRVARSHSWGVSVMGAPTIGYLGPDLYTLTVTTGQSSHQLKCGAVERYMINCVSDDGGKSTADRAWELLGRAGDGTCSMYFAGSAAHKLASALKSRTPVSVLGAVIKCGGIVFRDVRLGVKSISNMLSVFRRPIAAAIDRCAAARRDFRPARELNSMIAKSGFIQCMKFGQYNHSDVSESCVREKVIEGLDSIASSATPSSEE